MASACSGRAGKTRTAGAMATTLPISGIDRVRSRCRNDVSACTYHRRGEHHSARHVGHRHRGADRPHPGRPPPPAARRPGRGGALAHGRRAARGAGRGRRGAAHARHHARRAARGARAAVRRRPGGRRRGRPAAAGAGGAAGPRHGERRGQRAGPGREVDAAAVGLRAGRRPDPHRAGAAGHGRPQPDLPHPGPAPRHAAAALVRHVRRRRPRAVPRGAGRRGAAGVARRVPALGLPQAFATARLAGFRRRRRSRRGASPDGRAATARLAGFRRRRRSRRGASPDGRA